jgi:D-arabinitol 4-dehydrogenase
MFAAADPVAVFASDEKLFSTLAHSSAFSQLLRQSIDRVNHWLVQ